MYKSFFKTLKEWKQSTYEDDGVILSVVYDKSNKESFLVIIDAHSMKELARAKMSQALPIGFHGRFIK